MRGVSHSRVRPLVTHVRDLFCMIARVRRADVFVMKTVSSNPFTCRVSLVPQLAAAIPIVESRRMPPRGYEPCRRPYTCFRHLFASALCAAVLDHLIHEGHSFSVSGSFAVENENAADLKGMRRSARSCCHSGRLSGSSPLG